MIDWGTEWQKIQAIAVDYAVDPFWICAIRVAENGGPGKEFGVLSEDAPTYEDQCRDACATVRQHLAGYAGNPLVIVQGPKFRRVGYSLTWIAGFARAWAPPNASNDPQGLNHNWLVNASSAYARFMKAGTVS